MLSDFYVSTELAELEEKLAQDDAVFTLIMQSLEDAGHADNAIHLYEFQSLLAQTFDLTSEQADLVAETLFGSNIEYVSVDDVERAHRERKGVRLRSQLAAFKRRQTQQD